MDFAEWLKSEKLSDQSIQNYVGAIRGRLTIWAHIHGLTSNQLESIVDISEFSLVADELRESPEFKKWNKQGNGMYAAALNHYKSFLEALWSSPAAISAAYGPCHEQLESIDLSAVEPFDPKDKVDARIRVLREVVRRGGQRKFRRSLITAYSGRCAISGCAVQPLLEAAHITPYLGPDTNSITNGLLLRADLHTLWDLGLLAVDPMSRRIWMSLEVSDPAYQQFSSSLLLPPIHPSFQPSTQALQEQWTLVHDKRLARLSA